MHRLHQNRRGIRIKTSSAPKGCAVFLWLEWIFRPGDWECFAAPAASSFATMQRNQKSPGSDTMRLRRIRLVSYAVRTPDPKRNGSSAQEIPCIRRNPNKTVPAPIRLPPCSIQSVYSSTEQSACCAATFVPAQVTDRRPPLRTDLSTAARHSKGAAEYNRLAQTAAASGS